MNWASQEHIFQQTSNKCQYSHKNESIFIRINVMLLLNGVCITVTWKMAH